MACSQLSPASVLLMSGVRGLAVEIWISAIQTRHHNECVTIIEKVEHYKSIDQPEHEFLAMHIQGSTRKTVLVVERSVLPLNDQRSSAVLSYASAISSPSSALTSVHANNVISISSSDASQPLLTITQGHKPYNLLRTLHFPSGNHPSDFHVAALLQLMKQHSPSYDIIRHQCFWYAGTIFEVLNEVYSGHEKKNPNYFHLLGTFSGIAIPGLRHSLDEIIEQFKIRLEDYRLEKKASNPDYFSDEETVSRLLVAADLPPDVHPSSTMMMREKF